MHYQVEETAVKLNFIVYRTAGNAVTGYITK